MLAFSFTPEKSYNNIAMNNLEYLRGGKLIVEDAPMDLNGALNLTLLYLSQSQHLTRRWLDRPYREKGYEF